MITLKTLDKATAQEVFDQVARHLQNVHDTYQLQDWLDELKNIAREFSLEFHP